MPAYNAEKFIKEAIQSVIDQTYTNWELQVVDDGSTDNTAEIVFKEQQKDERIHYYFQKNGKQGKARNFGISKSKGTYLAFLDADDLWLPDKLSIQFGQIQLQNIDLVFSDSYYFNNKDVNDLSNKMEIQNNTFYDNNSIPFFLENNRIPILTVLVKKEKILDVGCFSENLEIQNVEDYHLWLKLLMTNHKFYSSDIILAKYRVHGKSATARDKLSLDKIPEAFFDLLQKHPKFKEQIEKELKLKFNLIYRKNVFTKSEMKLWIKKNTKFLAKNQIGNIILFLNYLLPTKVTKRLLIHLLND
jgi:glycosyltransferase involved in cell wall biosynthesis